MTTEQKPAPAKLSLSRSRDIPFNKLVLSERNVRRVKAGVSIEDLAEDIARRTLLQSLSVRPLLDDAGAATDKYEVQAGGRRYRALALLVRKKRLAKTAPIPCVVREEGMIEEDSLAENVQREELHPLDQFRAFRALSDQGLGAEDIAARFFVTPQVVRQRLKLASVWPALLDAYAEDEMTLDQLMAFTVTDDHARQAAAWAAVRHGPNRQPYHIRRLLTEKMVRAGDRRARFVGVEAYEAAGGTLARDLFSQGEEGWFENAALLERLVAEKLNREAEAIRAEGWKWIEAAPDFPYGHTAGLGRVHGEAYQLTEEERAEREKLRTELERLGEEWANADELPAEIDARFGEIEEALEAFETRPARYDPADIARAGVFVSIAGDGTLKTERGFVRPEDAVPAGAGEADEACDFAVEGDGASGEANADEPDGGAEREEAEDGGVKPLSDRLLSELSAHRTLALRNALAGDPGAAFLATLHALALEMFYVGPFESCLEITAKCSGLAVQGPDLSESPSAKAINARHDAWSKALPEDPADLWDALAGFDADSRTGLFAHCASLAVNAVHEPWRRDEGRKRGADRLARAVGLDMAASGWRTTAENYLGRVPKARILEAVREAKGEAAAARLGAMKKADMAAEAERLLADTAWLPEPLRAPADHRPDTDGDAGGEPAAPAVAAE